MTTTEPRVPRPEPHETHTCRDCGAEITLPYARADSTEPQPLTVAVRTAFIAVTRKHVSSPEAGADSVDVAIASALRDAEEAVLRYLDAARAVPAMDADVEAAFIRAVNAPSATGRGIAVPHYRDVERIWRAMCAALSGQQSKGEPQLLAALENDIRELRGANPGELAARLIERGWTLDAARAVPALERCAPYGNPHPNGEPCPDCIAYGYAARAVPALDAEYVMDHHADSPHRHDGDALIYPWDDRAVPALDAERMAELGHLMNSLGIVGPNIIHAEQGMYPDGKHSYERTWDGPGWCVCRRGWPCEAQRVGDLLAALSDQQSKT
jgi:hypothetical protein